FRLHVQRLIQPVDRSFLDRQDTPALRRENEDLRARLKLTASQIADLDTKNGDLMRKMERRKQESRKLAELEKQLSDAHEYQREWEQEVDQKEVEVRKLTTRITELEREIEDRSQVTTQQVKLEKQLLDTRRELANVQAQNQEYQERTGKFEKQLQRF